jgi:phenylacetate-CoA ligase
MKLIKNPTFEILDNMNASRAKWHTIVNEKLNKLLKWSLSNVPFYSNLSFEEGNAIEDLQRFPIVGKRELSRERSAFVSRIRLEGEYENSTGGSTGVPLQVLQNKEFRDYQRAGAYLFYTWAGWKPGDRILKIWGSPRDVLHQTKNFRGRLISFIRNEQIVDAFRISAESAIKYVDCINEFRPQILECYVDAAYIVASEILRKGLKLKHRPLGIIVSAGTLFPSMESVIEEAFQAPVFNRYGSREAGGIACTCPSGRIHVNPFTHFLEVVNDKGERIREGTGKVVLTLLSNLSMPLIRYSIGDVATVTEQETLCGCGREWQTLERIDGRTGDLIRKRDGTTISPFFFIHFLGVVHNKGFIDKYQVVQEDYDRIVVRVVLRDSFKPDNQVVQQSLGNLISDIKAVLGNEMEVRIDFCNHIDPAASGKYSFVVSKISHEALGK